MAAAKSDPGLRRALTLDVAGGPVALAEEIARQVQRLRGERGRVDAKKAVRIGREATRLIDAIVSTVGRDDPGLAFERLLDLLDAAESVLGRRTGEGRPLPETFGALAGHAAVLISRLDDAAQTERLDAVLRAVMAGAEEVAPDFVAQVGAALAPAAREALRGRIERELAAPGDDLLLLVSALSQLADAQGDVDAWIAAQSRLPSTARDPAGAARRLLGAGRAAEALDGLDAATPGGRHAQAARELRIAALEAGGRVDDAQVARWREFETSLSAQALRDYLKRLPDFEDVERESEALDGVARHRHPLAALAFLIAWPDLRRAGALVRARIEDGGGGEAYEVLAPAAEALAHRDPLAATILFRAMVDFALHAQRSARYAHAARHLDACAALAPSVIDWEGRIDHTGYVDRLFARHARQQKFWRRVAD